MSEQTRFTLRIGNELLEKVKDRASKNKRSVAKEIEYMLEKYIEEKEGS